jgi:alpha-tubulin suppressor-like RCC1 family protein
LRSWGLNSYGEVGDGVSNGPNHCHLQACSTKPVAVTGLPAGQLKAFSTGDQFELVLLNNGTVRAWGENDYGGELGDGTSSGPSLCAGHACSTTPVAVCAVGQPSCTFTSHELTNVAAISAGDYMSLALLTNGTVVAWGANQLGELGDGTTTGPDTNCGGETPCSLTPVPVCAVGQSSCTTSTNELAGVTAISSGNGANLALLATGTVVAWGESAYLGNGTTVGTACSGSCTPEPVVVCAVGGCGNGALSGVKAINAADAWNMALLNSGRLVTWGDPANGELGNGLSSGPYVTAPTYVCAVGGCSHGDLSGVQAIAGDDDFSLALLTGGVVRSWGENTQGQLGDGSTTNSATPVAVCAIGVSSCSTTKHELTEVAAIAAGESGYALLTNATVRAWGVNTSGELGDNTSTGPHSCIVAHNGCSLTPVAVLDLSKVKTINAGEFNAVAAVS